MKGSLDMADECGVCMKARLNGADQHGDEEGEEEEGLEALIKGIFHSMSALWAMRDDSMRSRRQDEQF